MAYAEKPTKSQIEGTHGWNLNAAVTDSLAENPNRMWPTPRANKVHPMITEENRELLVNRNKSNLKEVIAGEVGDATGRLNPTWVEWLMGYPEEWTDLKD